MATVASAFQPHLLLRGGHRQTIGATLRPLDERLAGTVRHTVSVSAGDAVVLHDDCPPGWREGDAAVLLIHGLCGCHRSSYMVRLAKEWMARVVRPFRLDMRGCGASLALCGQITHAGRSDDVWAALNAMAGLTVSGSLYAIGVSLGGNQLLRGLGEWGAGRVSPGFAAERLRGAAAVAPPVDLKRCSENMDRWRMRFYNRFFIRMLLQRLPPQLAEQSKWAAMARENPPRTLRELDDRFTAPLAGYADALDYYQHASAASRLRQIPIPTLVLSSEDDPIVPITSLRQAAWSTACRLAITRHGGHVGYIGGRQQTRWLEQYLVDGLLQA